MVAIQRVWWFSATIIDRGSRGLLLGHAVERAEPQHQVAAGDTNDLTIWEEPRERSECDAIVGVVEGWDQYQAVGDIEICVARWQALAVEVNRLRHGQRLDSQQLAVLVLHPAEASEIFAQRLVVEVGRI